MQLIQREQLLEAEQQRQLLRHRYQVIFHSVKQVAGVQVGKHHLQVLVFPQVQHGRQIVIHTPVTHTRAQVMAQVTVGPDFMSAVHQLRRMVINIGQLAAIVTTAVPFMVVGEIPQRAVMPGYISFSKSGYSGFGITCAQRNFSYSDVRLKTNINLVGKSPLGLNIYTWNYINEKHGVGTFKGVMAQEVPNYARTKDKDGFYMVDYNAIDVDFEKI